MVLLYLSSINTYRDPDTLYLGPHHSNTLLTKIQNSNYDTHTHATTQPITPFDSSTLSQGLCTIAVERTETLQQKNTENKSGGYPKVPPLWGN